MPVPITKRQQLLADLDNSSDSDADVGKPKLSKKAAASSKADAAAIAAAAPIVSASRRAADRHHASKFNAELDSSDEDAVTAPPPAKKKAIVEPTPGKKAPVEKKASKAEPPVPAKPMDLFGDDSSEEEEQVAPKKKKSNSQVAETNDDDDGPIGELNLIGKSSKMSTIHINTTYADNYEAVKRRQDLQRLMEKYKDEGRFESDSDEEVEDEEEDDEGNLLEDESKNDMFAEVLYRLRTNDPTVKDSSIPFFKAIDEGTAAATKGTVAKTAPVFSLKDEYRRSVLNPAGDMDEEQEEQEEGVTERDPNRKIRPSSILERETKKAFLAAVKEVAGDATTNEEDDDDNGIFTKREGVSSATLFGGEAKKKTAAPQELPERKKKLLAAYSTPVESGAPSTKRASKEDNFLQSFFANEMWKGEISSNSDDDEDENAARRSGKKIDWLKATEEERDDEFYFNAEQWEKEFQEKQYQHEMVEDPSELQIKSFGRRVGGEGEGEQANLLRKTKSTRQEARKRKAEREQEEEKLRTEELKRLKNLKKAEIEEQQRMIARVAGIKIDDDTKAKKRYLNEDAIEGGIRALSKTSASSTKKKGSSEDAEGDGKTDALKARVAALWTKEDLEKDFDPAEFDAKMASLFNDDYDDDMTEEELAQMRAELKAEDEDYDGTFDAYNSDDEDEEGDDFSEDDDVDDLFFYNESDEEDEEDGDNMVDDMDALISGGVVSAPAKEKKKASEDTANPAEKKAKKAASDAKKKASVAGPAPDSNYFEDDDLAMLYPDRALEELERAQLNSYAEEDAEEEEKANASMSKAERKQAKQAELNKLNQQLEAKVDDYYKLHYDKVITGGFKTRFKYKTVNAENFGLTDEDILTKDDRTLNMIAPMRLYNTYVGAKENLRDRLRCISRKKSMRTLDPTRKSRKYGDVEKTILFDLSKIKDEEEGHKIATKISEGARKLAELEGISAEEVSQVEKDLEESKALTRAQRALRKENKAKAEKDTQWNEEKKEYQAKKRADRLAGRVVSEKEVTEKAAPAIVAPTPTAAPSRGRGGGDAPRGGRGGSDAGFRGRGFGDGGFRGRGDGGFRGAGFRGGRGGGDVVARGRGGGDFRGGRGGGGDFRGGRGGGDVVARGRGGGDFRGGRGGGDFRGGRGGGDFRGGRGGRGGGDFRGGRGGAEKRPREE